MCISLANQRLLWLPWELLCSTGPVLRSTHFFLGTMGTVHSTHGVLRVLRYNRVLRVLYSTHGYYVVPETGYYRVLQAYAAAGMNRVRFRVRFRVCTPHARHLTFLRVILIKIGLERCVFKQNPVRVRVRVCIWDSNPNRLGYAYGIGLGLGLGLVGIGLCLGWCLGLGWLGLGFRW
jgi:hypothetical protein